MTFADPLSGTLEVAAALAFHLPGTRLDLRDTDGACCSVGPLTDPRCQMHPAEFRELVVAAGAGGLLGSMLGCSLDSRTQLSLAAPEGVEHVGGGLYRVAGRESVSFAFVTTLEASRVDAMISSRHGATRIDSGDDDGACEDSEQTAIALSLVQDDGLGVTLVVVCAHDMSETHISAGVAQSAMAACLVAELEELTARADPPAT